MSETKPPRSPVLDTLMLGVIAVSLIFAPVVWELAIKPVWLVLSSLVGLS